MTKRTRMIGGADLMFAVHASDGCTGLELLRAIAAGNLLACGTTTCPLLERAGRLHG